MIANVFRSAAEVQEAAWRLGLFKPRSAPMPAAPKKRVYSQARYIAAKRAALVAQGLTTTGTVRKNKLRPELRGLPPREKHRRYCQLWRAERAAA